MGAKRGKMGVKCLCMSSTQPQRGYAWPGSAPARSLASSTALLRSGCFLPSGSFLVQESPKALAHDTSSSMAEEGSNAEIASR